MKYDYDNTGKERDVVASPHTLIIYEQQFKSGLIEDVFGRISIGGHEHDIDEHGNLVVADYTIDNWTAYLKALWAMLKSGADLARAEGRKFEPVPNFEEWSIRATNLDMSEISRVVVTECQRGLFRAGAASEQDSQTDDEVPTSVHEGVRDGDGEVRAE